MTRLRITLKDYSLSKISGIKSLDGVLGDEPISKLSKNGDKIYKAIN